MSVEGGGAGTGREGAGQVDGPRLSLSTAGGDRQAPGGEGRGFVPVRAVQPGSPQRCPGNGLREQPLWDMQGGAGVPGGRKVTGDLAHSEMSLSAAWVSVAQRPCGTTHGPQILPPGWCLEERPRARPWGWFPCPRRGTCSLGASPTSVSSLALRCHPCWFCCQSTLEHSRTFWNILEHSGTLRNTLGMVTHA